MAIDFSADIQSQINLFLSTGKYADGEAVVREALDALRSRETEMVAIAEGIADMEAGRVQPLVEFDSEFRRRNNMPVE